MYKEVPYECGDVHTTHVKRRRLVCTVKYLDKQGKSQTKDVPADKDGPKADRYYDLPGYDRAVQLQQKKPKDERPKPKEGRAKKAYAKPKNHKKGHLLDKKNLGRKGMAIENNEDKPPWA